MLLHDVVPAPIQVCWNDEPEQSEEVKKSAVGFGLLVESIIRSEPRMPLTEWQTRWHLGICRKLSSVPPHPRPLYTVIVGFPLRASREPLVASFRTATSSVVGAT